MASKADWAVLTYIAAHNNLDQLGRQSLEEIQNVGSTGSVVQGVLYDGAAGATLSVMNVVPGQIKYQQPLSSFDSGDPAGLINTAKWFFGNYPAEHYGLVLWSHGTGWEPREITAVTRESRPQAAVDAAETRERANNPGGRALFRTTLRAILKPDSAAERAILFDDGTGHSLDTLELARVADKIAGAVGQPLDLLGMDACLMANMEVAYELRKTVRYLVASEELVPGHSWPYQQIYGALRANPDLSPPELAKQIVAAYVGYYSTNPPPVGDVTKVALDLAQVDALAVAAGRLAQVLREEMSQQAEVLWSAQHEALRQENRNGKRTAHKFQFNLWDLGSLASRLAAHDQAAPTIKQAALAVTDALQPGGAIIAEGHYGAWFDGIGGVSVYLVPPSASRRISPSYQQLAFAQDTHWDAMLQAYFEALV